jgi:hypothetical protein
VRESGVLETEETGSIIDLLGDSTSPSMNLCAGMTTGKRARGIFVPDLSGRK